MFTPIFKRQVERLIKTLFLGRMRSGFIESFFNAHQLLYDAAMSLSLRLHIEQRRSDRIFVVVDLGHEGSTVDINGAAVELRSKKGTLLSPRMILPISGLLAGPLSTRVELRAQRPIPQGSTVYGVVFWGGEQTEATIPADPCTDLQAHVTGARNISGYTSKTIENLSPEEEYNLFQQFPWTVKEEEEDDWSEEDDSDEESIDDLTDEVAKSLGLDEEEASYLRELLTDEVPKPSPE